MVSCATTLLLRGTVVLYGCVVLYCIVYSCGPPNIASCFLFFISSLLALSRVEERSQLEELWKGREFPPKGDITATWDNAVAAVMELKGSYDVRRRNRERVSVKYVW